MGWDGFGNSQSNTVATVGPYTVDKQEYLRAKQRLYRFYRDQLKQVVLNILQNALEAMPVNGALHLSIAEELYEDHQGLRLKVEDTGKGIDPKVLSRIFEPFFTTGKHRGTGIGLAICRNIIEAHGGEIHAESQQHHGTTISVWLPSVCQPHLAII